MDIINPSSDGNGAAAGVAPAAPAADVNTNPAAWYEGMDSESLGWLENRGVTKMNEREAIKNLTNGFRNAEKFIGAPAEKLLKIPDFNKASQDELSAFYGKLGRPESPDKYELEVPEGQPEDFANWAKEKFHGLGLNSTQAKTLSQEWNKYVAGIKESTEQASQIKAKEDDAALRREWGNAYDNQLNMSKNAAKNLGVTAEMLDKLEAAMGYGDTMRFMAKIGQKFGEAEYVGSGDGQSGPSTPQSAQARIASLKGDKEWVTKYLSGNIDAKAEMERLMKQAYGG